MASQAQLLEQLRAHSLTYGWGAVAVFDGATLAERLAAHYSLVVHGPAALKPISVERIDIVGDGTVHGTLDNVVLSAPRISFSPGAIADSRMVVSYDLAQGLYTEYRCPWARRRW